MDTFIDKTVKIDFESEFGCGGKSWLILVKGLTPNTDAK